MWKFFVSLSIETFKLFLNVRGAGSKLTEKQSAKKFRPRWPSFSAVGRKGDKSQKLSKTCNAVVARILVTVSCGQSTFSLHISFSQGWPLILAFNICWCTHSMSQVDWRAILILVKCWIMIWRRAQSLTQSKVWSCLTVPDIRMGINSWSLIWFEHLNGKYSTIIFWIG